MGNDLDKYGHIDHKIALVETLGQGLTCKTKLGIYKEDKKKVAVKIFKSKFDEEQEANLMKEIEALRKLKHKNIMQLYDFCEGVYYKNDDQGKNIKYLVLELAEGGELFDYIANTEPISEDLARNFFKQIIEAIQFCHDQGITHRDLKPENVMLDTDYNIKLIDFGFQAALSGEDGSGILKTRLGTRGYQAPEILAGNGYKGQPIDIFAAAVILFVMLKAEYPFNDAVAQDKSFKLILKGENDKFWTRHSQRSDPKLPDFMPSEEVKDLITGMWNPDPEKRLTMEQVLDHPWMKAKSLSNEEFSAELKKRYETLQNKKEAEREQKKAE